VRRTLATVGVLGDAFLVLGTTAATAHPPAPRPPPPSWPGPYGLGGKISLRPPVAWQPTTGPVDWRTLFAPLRAVGLPLFGPDINVSGGDAANEVTIAADPTRPLYFVAGANAPGSIGHYQPGPLLSFSGVRPRPPAQSRGPTAHIIHNRFTPPTACIPIGCCPPPPTRPCITNFSL
jgi:hypothetical protein